MDLKKNFIYIVVALAAAYWLWRKKLGSAGADTVFGGGEALEDQVIPGGQNDPVQHVRQDYLTAVGPLIAWLQDLRAANRVFARDVSQSWFPSRVRNNIVNRLTGWYAWIDLLLAAHASSYHISVADFARISSAWTGHMFFLDNENGHGVNYNDNEERHAVMAAGWARSRISPIVSQYNNLDDNLFGFYEQYAQAGVVEPESHLP